MKAAIVKSDRIVIEEVEKPTLSDKKGAIIKVVGCGLCGSDIVKLKHHVKNGTVLGHEIVGEIVEINATAPFLAGDKIVMGHHVPCYDCIFCKSNNYSMCRHFKTTNIMPGGFSEYIFASEEHLNNTVFKIPQNMDEITASFLEPLGCCVRAVSRANLPENSTSLIIGLGSIGLLMGQAAKAKKQRVLGCDLLENRVEFAEKLNFDKAFLSDNIENVIDEIKKYTNGIGVDAVYMTSGAYQTIPLALNTVRDGGKIIVFSSVSSLNGYSNNDIYYRELTILGSYSPSPKDLSESLQLLKSGEVSVQNFSRTYGLNDIEIAIDHTVRNKILKAYIKL